MLHKWERWFAAWCLALILCVWGQPAHASGVVSIGANWHCTDQVQYTGDSGTSREAACKVAADLWKAANNFTDSNGRVHTASWTYGTWSPGTDTGPGNGSVVVNRTQTTTYTSGSPDFCSSNCTVTSNSTPGYSYTEAALCPTNSTNSSGTCTCNSTYAPNFNSTACQTACTSGGTINQGVYTSTDPAGGIMGANSGGCTVNGCAAVFTGFTPQGETIIAGQRRYFFTGTYTATGQACNSGLIPPPPVPVASSVASAASAACGTGQQQGTVNGQTFCWDPTTGKPVDPPKSTETTTVSPPASGPSGSTVQTTTVVKTNPDGTTSTTVTTKSTAADGTVTTTSTTTGSGLTNPGGVGYANIVSGQSSAPSTGTGGAGGGGAGGCSDNPSAHGCGGAAGGTGDGYTEKDRTFAQVLADRKTQWEATSVGSSMAGFFTVSESGTCPTWSLDLAYFDHSYTIDQFCTTWAATMFLVIKAAVLCIFGFYAFRVAVL